MEGLPRTSTPVGRYSSPVTRTNDYIKRLLIERPRIRARLENPMAAEPGTDMAEFSANIGNPFHLDLLAAEEYVKGLRPEDRKTLTDWVNGVTSEQAGLYHDVRPQTIRMRRKRVIDKMKEALDAGEDA